MSRSWRSWRKRALAATAGRRMGAGDVRQERHTLPGFGSTIDSDPRQRSTGRFNEISSTGKTTGASMPPTLRLAATRLSERDVARGRLQEEKTALAEELATVEGELKSSLGNNISILECFSVCWGGERRHRY